MALPVSTGARRRLDRALAPYRRTFAEARWLEPDTWHVTLLFLGSVSVARIGELVDVVDSVATICSPLTVEIDGAGGRSDRGGRRSTGSGGHVTPAVRRSTRAGGIAWLHIGTGATTIVSLADRLLDGVRAIDLIEPERLKRSPSAHVTVARKASATLIEALREQRHGPVTARWRVDRILILESHLEAAGAHYETVHEAPCHAQGQGRVESA